MPFSKLGLSEPLLKAIAELNYSEPTAIQKKAIPVILSGKNLVAAAQTGTGKTASFVLPILEKLNTDRKLRGKRISTDRTSQRSDNRDDVVIVSLDLILDVARHDRHQFSKINFCILLRI